MRKSRSNHSLKRKKTKKLSREEKFILDVLAVLFAFVLLLRYISDTMLLSIEWFSGNQLARFFLALAVLIISLINIRKKRALIGLLTLLPFFLVVSEVVRFVPFKGIEQGLNHEERIRVLTCNMATKSMDGVIEQISADSVDIACLQEVPLIWSRSMHEHAKASGYNGRYVLMRDDAGMGTMILSREPIFEYDTLYTSSWGDKIRRFSRVTTTHNGKQIRVVSVQLESTNRKSDLWGVIQSWQLRTEQAGRVRDALTTERTPLILAGDMNSTPTNRAVRPLLKAFTDSWLVGGRGLGATWHVKIPLLRIDYILYRGFNGAANTKIFPLGESDHQAYRVDLVLN